jgi:hypothetical protein
MSARPRAAFAAPAVRRFNDRMHPRSPYAHTDSSDFVALAALYPPLRP